MTPMSGHTMSTTTTRALALGRSAQGGLPRQSPGIATSLLVVASPHPGGASLARRTTSPRNLMVQVHTYKPWMVSSSSSSSWRSISSSSSFISAAAPTTTTTFSKTASASPLVVGGLENHVTTSTSAPPEFDLPVLPPPRPSPAIDSTAAPKPYTGAWWRQRLWNRFSITLQQERILRAEGMFQAATRQAADPRWFGPGRIGREFRPRHALLTMHIWFLHKRLISSHPDDAADREVAWWVQEELFNILWEDTACRIRQQPGVQELFVNKYLGQVQQYTFLHLTHYDHVYTEFLDQPHQRLKELRRIVWQHILVRNPEAEHRTDQLDRIAWYIDANYRNIVMEWPDRYYREGRVAWVDLPNFDGMKDATGQQMEESPVHPDDVLPEPWLRNITLKGIDYYWNPETREATWERPLA